MKTNVKNNTFAKKAIAAALAVTMMFGASVIPSVFEGFSDPLSLSVSAASGIKFDQRDSKWYNVSYNGSNLHDSGCGIFSFGNAIYALNGNTVDVNAIAKKTASNGSWGGTGGKGVRNRDKFFSTLSSYGDTYHFTMGQGQFAGVESSSLTNHLKNGGVAVAHVDNHFIAIVGYNQNNKTYHIIESFVSKTTSKHQGRDLAEDSWVSASKLKSGRTNVDWFILISNKSNSQQVIMKAYTITSGNSAVYTDPSFSVRKGTVYGSDELWILKATTKYIYFTYQVSGTNKRKDGYMPITSVLAVPKGYYKHATRQIKTYKRAGQAYGYISPGDYVWIGGTKGSYTNVRYEIGKNTYKIAWILTSDVKYLK